VVINDNGQVTSSAPRATSRLEAACPLPFAVPDLVNPDPAQPVEQIDIADCLGCDPHEERADRSPRHSHQLRDRGL
jgi:hypothetical protein